MSDQLNRLLLIMARLRDPDGGCEWDLAQTFETIAPYTIEEAYEVADAIERGDMIDLKSELGDLLLQVVFHSRIAEENGAFDFSDVAQSISDKMEARHPHIFGDVDGEMTERRWEDLKAEEREQAGISGALAGVAKSLPSLQRAQKLQKRAARQGFDWPDASGPLAKIHEELAELQSATPEQIAEEAGDLLFAIVNFLRFYQVDSESALRQANLKFERRFAAMEALADGNFAELDLAEQERLWQRVKSEERHSQSEV